MSHTITASAPGSLMIAGEHAVLRGRRAVVAAVAQRVRVRLTARPGSDRLHVESALGRWDFQLAEIGAAPPPAKLRFVLAALARRREQLPHGLDLHIEADMSDQVGFASSAAVTVATAAALRRWLGEDGDARDLFLESREIIRAVQGVGSGADAAAAVYGGAVLYRAEPLEVEKLPHLFPLTAVYSGHKTPTPEVVAYVEQRRQAEPERYARLFDAIDACVGRAAEAIRRADGPALGAALNDNQALMEQMGVNTPALAAIIAALRATPGVLGAKISGSGLGDCAIGLGAAAPSHCPGQPIPVTLSAQGVSFEEEGRR